MFRFDIQKASANAPRVAVVGVGGGGCKTVSRFHGALTDLVTVAVNTDSISLGASQATTKIRIGVEETEGKGAGGSPDIGRMAAEHDREMLRGVFSDVDLAVIVTSLGGGTGSGATPVLLRAAAESDTLLIVLASLPFDFESSQRREIARAALHELRELADVVVPIENSRLIEASGKAGVAEAFECAVQAMVSGTAALVRMLAHGSLLTVDAGDLRRISNAGGQCSFAYATAAGTGRVDAAVDALLNSPLLDNGRLLKEAPTAVLAIAAASDLAIAEVDAIVRDVTGVMSRDCDVVVGINTDDRWGEQLQLSVLVGSRVKRAVGGPREAPPEPTRKRARRRTKAKDLQAKLRLDVSGKGRFKDVEATILDGEDLDIPTYVRRGIEIEK